MFQITDAADLSFILSSIENGYALDLADKAFVDSDMTGADYYIRFYSLAGSVFRSSWNSRTTVTTIHEVCDDHDKACLLMEAA